MITVTPLPAFSDNYLWLLEHDGKAAVVDPGDGEVVLSALRARNLELVAILITHHHPDHIGGLPALLAEFDVPVYGPRAEADKIRHLSHLLDGGDEIEITSIGARFKIIAVPGHTLGHIAYHEAAQSLLFCGDTLFVAGCGRLFEGTPAQMHDSLSKLAALPPATAVYCAHEYTLGNLDFATAVEPENSALADEVERVIALRAAGTPSVPSTIGRERSLNPFLRASDPALAAAATRHSEQPLGDPVAVFAELRRWKDGHRPRSR